MLKIVVLSFLCGISNGFSQSLSFFSEALQTNRTIDVYLPENYDSLRAYPVMYVLDGNYVGGIAHETNEFLAYFDRSFPCITVAIRQDSTRWADCGYSWKNNDYTERGKQFLEFLTQEVPQYIGKQLKTTTFTILVGHSFTASYACLDWNSESAHFSEYIALSPYLPDDFLDALESHSRHTKKGLTIITSDHDLSGHRMGCTTLAERIAKEPNAVLAVQNVGNKTHSTLVPVGLEVALNRLYQPMQSCFNAYSDVKSLKEMPVMTLQDLLLRYENCTTKFGITAKPKAEDVEFALMTLETRKNRKYREELANWAIVQFPENYVGYYGLASVFEEQKDFQKALELYEKGYSKLGDDTLNKADFYRDVERMKKKIHE